MYWKCSNTQWLNNSKWKSIKFGNFIDFFSFVYICITSQPCVFFEHKINMGSQLNNLFFPEKINFSFTHLFIYTKYYMFQESAFLCYDTEDYEIIAKLSYYPYGLLISCIFLAMTLLVYLLLPKVFHNWFYSCEALWVLC